jgi:hypothetical protein
VEPAAPAASPAERAARPPDPGRVYQKPDGVFVDVHFLCGQDFERVRDQLSAQMGGMLEAVELEGKNGRELRLERGLVRVVDDRVYMIRVSLPEALRRAEALAATGFPPAVGQYITTQGEYRLNQEWGFRRVRLKRLDTRSELVTQVEAWRWKPNEHSGRR